MPPLSPERTEFVIVSFEGPDEYSRAGGLAVRVRDLSTTLAEEGYRTHLFFVGDPAFPAVEEHGNLILHRWGQWISAYHPGGVYDGEVGKMQDLAGSLPSFLRSDIVRPAALEGKVVVLMGEDWQTVSTMINASRLFAEWHLLPYVIPVWTANNLFGFHGLDFGALARAAEIMTVSRYMKHEMWAHGVNPLVVPNGIAPSALVSVPSSDAKKLRKAFDGAIALFKIGRFDPDKRWHMALEAVAILNQMGQRTRILIRGDRSPHGQEVLARAWSLGLVVENLEGRFQRVGDLADAITERPLADVLNLVSFLPDSLLPVVYAGVDGVLANSGHEPFGLVGLEVMGAGGLAYVGSTGEEYAEPDRNAVVLDTDDPREIVVQVLRIQGDKDEAQRLKKQGKKTAKAYLWDKILSELLTKLTYVAMTRGVEVTP